MKTTLLILSLITGSALAASRDVASVRNSERVDHARELMGTSYKKSIVGKQEKNKNLEKKIYELVSSRLPKKYNYKSYSVARAIIEESHRHSLDPYFVMAVIAGESSFNPDQVGSVGEIGLMQIRPGTGEWIADMKGMKWKGKKSLFDPATNIKLGVSYLAWLRTKFEGHGQLYVAAYNMGPKAVRNAVSRDIYPKDYPRHVMKRYIAFYKEAGQKKI